MESYSFIERKGQKYAIHIGDPVLHFIESRSPFSFMENYTVEECRAWNVALTQKVEQKLDESWAEIKTKVSKCKTKAERSTLLWSLAQANTKETYKKKWREGFRQAVEHETPKRTIDDFRHPLENGIFRQTVLEALRYGAEESQVDEFVNRIIDLRKTSYDAALKFFEFFAEDPSRIAGFGMFVMPKEKEAFGTQPLFVQWHMDIMKARLHFPRNTGKGELGLLALLSGNVRLLSSDKRGDILVHAGTPDEFAIEVKCISTRSEAIRWGSEVAWADSTTYVSLDGLPLRKKVSRKLIQDYHDDIKKRFGSVQHFLQCATTNIRTMLLDFGKVLVYIEDEEVVEELDPMKIGFYGVSQEGRWKFTIGPNTMFQGL